MDADVLTSLCPTPIPQATALPFLTHLAPFLSLLPRLPSLAPGTASSSLSPTPSPPRPRTEDVYDPDVDAYGAEGRKGV